MKNKRSFECKKTQSKLQRDTIFRSFGGHFGFKFYPIQRKSKKYICGIEQESDEENAIDDN